MTEQVILDHTTKTCSTQLKWSDEFRVENGVHKSIAKIDVNARTDCKFVWRHAQAEDEERSNSQLSKRDVDIHEIDDSVGSAGQRVVSIEEAKVCGDHCRELFVVSLQIVTLIDPNQISRCLKSCCSLRNFTHDARIATERGEFVGGTSLNAIHVPDSLNVDGRIPLPHAITNRHTIK